MIATLEPKPGSTQVVPLPEARGSLIVPNDAINGAPVRMEVRTSATPTSVPTGMTVLAAIDVSLTSAAGNTPVTELSQDVTIELSYAGLGLTQAQLDYLVIYNASRGEYLPTSLDRSRQVVIARTRRFSTFTLGLATIPIPRSYVPFISNQLRGGW